MEQLKEKKDRKSVPSANLGGCVGVAKNGAHQATTFAGFPPFVRPKVYRFIPSGDGVKKSDGVAAVAGVVERHARGLTVIAGIEQKDCTGQNHYGKVEGDCDVDFLARAIFLWGNKGMSTGGARGAGGYAFHA